MDLSIAQVAAATDAVFAGGKVSEQRITGVVIDNRLIRGGELFVAISGEHTDGNRYAKAALDAGATAVLTSDPRQALASGADPDRLLKVDETVIALGKLAKYWLAYLREHTSLDLQVVGITGSVGKTTTKDLLARLLTHRGAVVAPPNSFNNEIGLALTVLRADFETKTLVLEMGADRSGNIAYLTDIAPPDISLVLIVAKAHLGNFGTLEQTVEEKSQIIAGTAQNGIAILNADDPNVASMAQKAQCRIIYFSVAGVLPKQADADAVNTLTENVRTNKNPEENSVEIFARAENISEINGHAHFTLCLAGEKQNLTLGLAGMHHISNALAASAAAKILDVDFADIVAELENAKPASPHRMDVRKIGDTLVIDDSYNANPTSMRAGIAALGSFGANCSRRIAVLGQMLELGENTVAEHLALLPALLAAKVTDLYLVGTDALVLAAPARESGMYVAEFSSADFLISQLDRMPMQDSAILFKGSNGTRVWEAADMIINKGCVK